VVLLGADFVYVNVVRQAHHERILEFSEMLLIAMSLLGGRFQAFLLQNARQ
jgi:hypothetical protein